MEDRKETTATMKSVKRQHITDKKMNKNGGEQMREARTMTIQL